jgi:DNA-binding transcriptional LysR family regulator
MRDDIEQASGEKKSSIDGLLGECGAVSRSGGCNGSHAVEMSCKVELTNPLARMARIDVFSGLTEFMAVADQGSFRAAAAQLRVSAAAVSQAIKALEARVGMPLFLRTTRSVALTEAGLLALSNGRALLDRYEAIEADVRESTQSVRGVIRVGTPPAFGAHHLAELVHAFMAQHPEIQVVLQIDVGDTNMIAAGLDCTIRITKEIEDSSHIALPLAPAPQVMVASPAYLREHGVPRTLKDLAQHNCLVHSIKSAMNLWRFTGPKGKVSTRVRGTLVANFGEPLRESALRGHGISIHPYYMVSEDLAKGRLVKLLPAYEPEGAEVFVVYSSREHLPHRVRRFIAFLREWSRTPPEWSLRGGT